MAVGDSAELAVKGCVSSNATSAIGRIERLCEGVKQLFTPPRTA